MNLLWQDWAIVFGMLAGITAVAIYTKRYTKSVVDFLAANRCARRYLLSIANGMAGLGAITIIGGFQQNYQAGFAGQWWSMMGIPFFAVIFLTGFISYRIRETRALTLSQFFQVRYSKSFRIYAGILCFVAGILNFGIFPSVGARFFIYFCGLPAEFSCCGLLIETYPALMIVLLSFSLFFVFLGGQIAVIITDFIQGAFANIVLLAVLVFLFCFLDLDTIITTIQESAPENASKMHPFEGSNIEGFNYTFFMILMISSIYMWGSWQGTQAYNCSSSSAHETKMSGILQDWRVLMPNLIILILPMAVYVILHYTGNDRPEFATISQNTDGILNGISNDSGRQIADQMRVPVVLAQIIPTWLKGMFAAMMLMAFISTHDTYLHSWGSVFMQDVILPFRKKPLSTRAHLWGLRLCIFAVAVFIFLFSYFFRQTDHIMMFFQATAAIFAGGAGICIIGGLYSRWGTNLGAWTGMTLGALIAFGGVAIQANWFSFDKNAAVETTQHTILLKGKDRSVEIYTAQTSQFSYLTSADVIESQPFQTLLSQQKGTLQDFGTFTQAHGHGVYHWLQQHPALLNSYRNSIKYLSRVPGINWQTSLQQKPHELPVQGMWFNLLSMIVAIGGYILASLLENLFRGGRAFNREKMLHRGKYALEGEHEHHVRKPATGWRTILPTAEYSTGDKAIYWIKIAWTVLWSTIFIVGTIWNFQSSVSEDSWKDFWYVQTIFTAVCGGVCTIWFLIGGLFDVRYMFRQLKTTQRNTMDTGMVVGHHNLEDETTLGDMANDDSNNQPAD